MCDDDAPMSTAEVVHLLAQLYEVPTWQIWEASKADYCQAVDGLIGYTYLGLPLPEIAFAPVQETGLN